MTEPSRKLVQGSIIELDVVDPRGNRKPHPVVIITRTKDILGDNSSLVGIVISSSVPNPLPMSCEPVPWHRDRHPMTGLDRRCAAVCDWAVAFHPSEILSFRGTMPLKYVRAIVERFMMLSGPGP